MLVHPVPRMLTTRQVARLLGVSTVTLRRYIHCGAIRPVRLPGGVYRIPQEELDRFVAECQQDSKKIATGT